MGLHEAVGDGKLGFAPATDRLHGEKSTAKEVQ